MTMILGSIRAFAILGAVAMSASPALANALREKDKLVDVADKSMAVTPPRDWNRLDAKPGKHVEVWTLDGEQLNEVTFYGGVEPGKTLVRERDKKREPLPQFTASTLLIELPELLEGTYRAYKQIGRFTLTGSMRARFLGREGVSFNYSFTDQDHLPRMGEARAVLIGGKLYMMTFDAPRLQFFQESLDDFQALADAARLHD